MVTFFFGFFWFIFMGEWPKYRPFHEICAGGQQAEGTG
jgi:hypothetical protein